MVKPTPRSSLVLTQREFLLEVRVIPLDPPAQLGGVHQGAPADAFWQRGQKVFRRRGFVRGPFDQALFLGAWCGTVIIAMRRTDPYGGKP